MSCHSDIMSQLLGLGPTETQPYQQIEDSLVPQAHANCKFADKIAVRRSIA
jgi:hypothetical protein